MDDKPVTSAQPMRSIPALTAAAAERFGDGLAVVDGDVRLTYGELVDQARTFGAALVASGVEPGDRVAIWCFNCAEWIVALLGLFDAGAVLVPVNTRFKGAEAADMLARSHARVLVTVTDFLDTDYVAMLADSGVELPDLAVTVVIKGPAPAGTVGWDDFMARADDACRAEVARRAAAVSPDDASDILFTSGTTGRPKGVVQTHSRTLAVVLDWASMAGLGPADRYLMVNPYFHMFGLKAGILASVSAGVTMVPVAVFDSERVLELVEQERITVLPGAPTIYQSILDHPDRDRHDLSTLRLAVTGAAEIPVELIRRTAAELPFEVIIAGYGLTEGGTATATAPGDDPEVIATTVGRPRPGFEIRLVDGQGVDVPVGERGEVLMRSPSVMLRYLDDPQATAEVLSDAGWLKTGDIGILDEAGNLKIVGRSKDMFIVGGFNAYPAEIENFLLAHPAVEQVAVVGMPHPRLGEVGMAFVVRHRGATVTEDELIAWSREKMANYKVPRAVAFVDALPINATGKVVREELKAKAAQR
jgi:acyl-CoA synthetase (AMP-forming)/AMP-acid ligase II